MIVSRQSIHYRSYQWMNRRFGRPMPQRTNLCRYFWPAIFSLMLFPFLYVIWQIIKWPLMIITWPARAIVGIVHQRKQSQKIDQARRERQIAGFVRMIATSFGKLRQIFSSISFKRPQPEKLPIIQALELCLIQEKFYENLLLFV